MKILRFSQVTQDVLKGVHEKIAITVDQALQAVAGNDQKAAQDVIALKTEITRLIDTANAHLAERLMADEPNRLAAYTMEVDLIEKLKRIYYFAKRMAKAVAPQEVAASAGD